LAVTSRATATNIFRALASVGFNQSQTGRRLTHTVVVMFIKEYNDGRCVWITSPDRSQVVPVAFGEYTHHEFGHACGGLGDEYIFEADSAASGPGAPSPLSIFRVSNLTRQREAAAIPWAHLMPGSALNPDPASVIGVLWVGGFQEHGVWHSEARCIMNGARNNWDLKKTSRGADLSDPRRFCFWCEEILVARLLQRTGQLGDSTDGAALWKQWEQLRPLYHKAFNVRSRLERQNAVNAALKLPEALIYERPVRSNSARTAQ
jgi:hypothetical protein